MRIPWVAPLRLCILISSLCLLSLVLFPTSTAFLLLLTTPPSTTRRTTITRQQELHKQLFAEGNRKNYTNKIGKRQGVYVRPSAAIERGSGFFFPGLEGPKVRLFFGAVLLGLTVLNHVISDQEVTAAGNTFSEGLVIMYTLLVILQGAVEFQKDSLQKGIVVGGGGGAAAAANEQQQAQGKAVTSYQQQWSIPVEDASWREKVEWAAFTYISLTSATHMMLVGPGKVLYSLGITEQKDVIDPEACQAALDTVNQSKSGRVALPPQHPSVIALTDPNFNRCVVLQRIGKNNSDDSQLCWLMTSNQLLAGFNQQDLQWLGQLARFVDPE